MIKMKTFKRLMGLVLATSLTTGLMVGCGSNKGTDDSEVTSESDEGTSDTAEEEPTVVTAGDENGGWNAMRYGITETLFKFNDNMELEPWLAESYTVNDEHTEWVVTLKKGLKFSDGCDLTASKVKEAYEHLKEVGPSGSAKPEKYLEFEATIDADDEAGTLTIKTHSLTLT
mgnify:CR=1 FL=1